MYKMVITCAVTGAETTRKDNPNLPVTPEEIASAAADACAAGASIIHLHVRDAHGQPTQDVEVFGKAIELIRAKCDAVIEVTTGGAVGMTLEERIQPLALKPEMASLDCGTMNFADEYILNTMPMLRKCATEMKSQGVRPTLECFDLSHVDASKVLIKEGLVAPPLHYSIVLNVPAGVRYDADTLNFFVRRIPADSFWTVIAIGGKASLNSIFAAVAAGGFIRVGFEDNVYYSKGVLADSNAQLVERAADVARRYGCDIATPSDVRRMFKLRS
jgi:3-keto-5-aminohexanoate cleavage enzyme